MPCLSVNLGSVLSAERYFDISKTALFSSIFYLLLPHWNRI